LGQVNSTSTPSVGTSVTGSKNTGIPEIKTKTFDKKTGPDNLPMTGNNSIVSQLTMSGTKHLTAMIKQQDKTNKILEQIAKFTKDNKTVNQKKNKKF